MQTRIKEPARMISPREFFAIVGGAGICAPLVVWALGWAFATGLVVLPRLLPRIF